MPFEVTPTIPPVSNQGRGTLGWEYAPGIGLGIETPGSPEWWLLRGINAIQGKQEDHLYRERMVSGDHDPPNGDRRYVRALKDFQYKAKTNYVELATFAPIQRMKVKDFRFGVDESEEKPSSTLPADPGEKKKEPKEKPAPNTPKKDSPSGSSAQPPDPLSEPIAPKSTGDKDARKSWAANDMDYQMETLLTDCATYGEGYILVGAVDEESGEPVITTESPRVAHVFADPQRPTKGLAGVRLWRDEVLGHIIAVLYLPGTDYIFIGPNNKTALPSSISNLDSFEFASALPNELEEIPLVRARWKPDNTAEAENVFSVQDRINLTILDRLVISKSQAYRQRWLTGGQIAEKYKKKGGKVDQKPPFDPGSDTIWHVPAPDAKFGDFDQADIHGILEAIRDDVIDLAALTQTPPHYLMGRLANISGDTLTQAESGFVARVKMRQRAVGWAIEKAMRLVFKLKGDAEKAKNAEFEVIWADPQVRPLSEKADAAVKFAQAFSTAPPYMVPILAEMMDLDPDQIDMMTTAAEQWQQQQMQREEMMFERQTEAAKELAETGAKNAPSGKPQPGASSGSGTKPKPKPSKG